MQGLAVHPLLPASFKQQQLGQLTLYCRSCIRSKLEGLQGALTVSALHTNSGAAWDSVQGW